MPREWHCEVRDARTGEVLVGRVEQPTSMLGRSRGLLGRKALAPGAGLWLEPCSGVHTLGMRFAIDAVFVARDGAVIGVEANLRPWRFAGPMAGGRAVLELVAGEAARLAISPGRTIALCRQSDL